MDDIPSPSPDDLDDLTETVLGKPLKQPADQALARCQRQKLKLTEELAHLQELSLQDSVRAQVIRAELRDLDQRIREHNHQVRSRN